MRKGKAVAESRYKMHFGQRMRRPVLAALVCATVPFISNVQAQEVACEIDQPVRVSAMPWSSNQVLLEVQRFIVAQAYQCEIEAVDTPLDQSVQFLVDGKVDVVPELWLKTAQEEWAQAESQGKVVRVAELYMGTEPEKIPSALAGHVPNAESPRAEAIPACISDPKCEYPKNPVFSALSQDFYQRAPQLSAFYANVRIAPEVMAEIEVKAEAGESSEDLARWFLTEHSDVWRQWVSITAAQRVQQAL